MWALINKADEGGKEQADQLRFRAVLINLAQRRGRLKDVVEQLEQHEPVLLPKMCRLPAVDGRNDELMQRIISRRMVSTDGWRDLSRGMIGCCVSHWQALKLIASDKSIDFGVIIEDDLSDFSPDFHEQVSQLWNNTNGRAEAFWRDADVVYIQQDGSGWFKGKPRDSTPTTLKQGKPKKYWPKNTAMYAVRREFAQWLTDPQPKRTFGENGRLMPMWTQIDSILPGFIPRLWYFHPPIAQAKRAAKESGDSDVQLTMLSTISSTGRSRREVPDCVVQPL